MLHNSLFRRDALRSMNHHPLALARREVHRNVRRRGGAGPAPGQIALEGAWAIGCARELPAEQALARDAADFLTRVGLTIDPAAPGQLLLEVGSAPSGFRCVVSAHRVEVHGSDAAALWAGWIHLENQMRASGGPFLAAGEIQRTAAWETQIAPPTWGANYSVPDLSVEFLGEDTFRSLAHAGADGMFVYGDFLLYCKDSSLPELDHGDAAKNLAMLREASERAAPFGVKLWLVAVSPKLPENHALFQRLPAARGAKLAHLPGSAAPALHCLCSSSEPALKWHAQVMGDLFRACPELGGLICIIGGESYYHCFMRAADAAIGQTNCPHCRGKNAEEVVAAFVKNTSDAVKSATPHAAVLAWPYSAQYFWSNEPNQLKFIDRLPKTAALLSEVDKDQTVMRGGYPKRIWDYSVDYDGHSDRIVAQAMRCAQRGRDLWIKTETSHGIELLHLPYVPAIGRSASQWQSVRALRPRGVLQRWGFIGMFDSAAERIGYLARWDPDFAPQTATLNVARQLVGELAPQLVAAWGHFDESVHHIPVLTTGAYYTGPAFLGPCHPLPVWGPDQPVPDAFRGNLYYLLEGEASFSHPHSAGKDDLTLTRSAQLKAVGDAAPIEAIEAEFARARDAARRGHEILFALKPGRVADDARAEWIEQQALGEYLYRTFVATVNTLKFIRISEAAAQAGARAELRAIARDELENARAARGIYAQAPWLNHALRLDVGAPDSLVMIQEKLRLLEEYLR
jgi:hypothetical protein